MLIRRKNSYREFITKKLLGLVYRLENIGSGDIKGSGELAFIDSIAQYYKNRIIFFDIGANIGEYTDNLKSKRKCTNDEYHLFEPQKDCFDVLSNKFSNDKLVHLNNIGLSDISTKTSIYKTGDKTGLSSLYKRNLDFYNIKMDDEEMITLDRASDHIKRNNIRKINLIKIDVEGNEIKTMNGFGDYLNSDFIDFIQFEYGGANIDSRTNLLDFFDLLNRKGFMLCRMMKNHLEAVEYDPRFENFICQNYVAVSNNIFSSLCKK